eukprot:TRINITY_DN3634_c0_g1_i6.p1 TRINITY_DN3634_c0_g1~~TRINITY_DN3634_c0_g1_i6.p1  ORF type:complete len:550 (+),score=87.52 TRINITY_DN3634_c0_g1_i6:385-2034(+)
MTWSILPPLQILFGNVCVWQKKPTSAFPAVRLSEMFPEEQEPQVPVIQIMKRSGQSATSTSQEQRFSLKKREAVEKSHDQAINASTMPSSQAEQNPEENESADSVQSQQQQQQQRTYEQREEEYMKARARIFQESSTATGNSSSTTPVSPNTTAAYARSDRSTDLKEFRRSVNSPASDEDDFERYQGNSVMYPHDPRRGDASSHNPNYSRREAQRQGPLVPNPSQQSILQIPFSPPPPTNARDSSLTYAYPPGGQGYPMGQMPSGYGQSCYPAVPTDPSKYPGYPGYPHYPQYPPQPWGYSSTPSDPSLNRDPFKYHANSSNRNPNHQMHTSTLSPSSHHQPQYYHMAHPDDTKHHRQTYSDNPQARAFQYQHDGTPLAQQNSPSSNQAQLNYAKARGAGQASYHQSPHNPVPYSNGMMSSSPWMQNDMKHSHAGGFPSTTEERGGQGFGAPYGMNPAMHLSPHFDPTNMQAGGYGAQVPQRSRGQHAGDSDRKPRRIGAGQDHPRQQRVAPQAYHRQDRQDNPVNHSHQSVQNVHEDFQRLGLEGGQN